MRPDTLPPDSTWERVVALYEERGHRPLWSGGGRLRPAATSLLAEVGDAGRRGLDPADYDAETLAVLGRALAAEDSAARWLRPRWLARFDVNATWAYLRMAEHLRRGALPGDTLDPDWARPGDGDLRKRLLEGVGREDPAEVFATLEPAHEGYRRLIAALAAHRAVAAGGGWDSIPSGAPLERGARGPRVAALIRRLAATGDLPAPHPDTVMDAALVRAVGDFQTRQGLPRSGIVGEATRAALNVPVGRRIRQMELNLERWRWLPAALGERHVRVNIPAYQLEIVRADTVRRAMRAVVGKRKSPTPVFSSRIRYIDLNPTWTLPVSIVFDEILPAMRKKRDYLAQNQIAVVSIADKRDTLDPRTIPWSALRPDSFPYLLIQAAGELNPLGRIKLMCPNEYDVYLHDTPHRERFSDAQRDYSHGCVRVANATELADSVIGLPADKAERLDSLIATRGWKRLRLTETVPVHFLYWTAWADSAGRVSFREDLYGLDARLEHALSRRGDSTFVLNPGVGLSPYWLAARDRALAQKLAKAPTNTVPATSATSIRRVDPPDQR